MKIYPLSKELEAALKRLYPNQDTGKFALGLVGPSFAAREPFGNPSTPYVERIREFVHFFEGWVDLNSRQLAELESEYDETRLKSEARAMLLALREIHRLFPESFDEDGPVAE